MKKCCMCKQLKEDTCFSKDKSRKDGLNYKCKNCNRIFNREKRERNKSNYLLKDSRYYQKHKQEIIEKNKAWYRNNKIKVLAHQKVKNALYNGKIIKKPCEICGELKSQAHHDDYSKPLEVMWLCAKHHRLREIGEC